MSAGHFLKDILGGFADLTAEIPGEDVLPLSRHFSQGVDRQPGIAMFLNVVEDRFILLMADVILFRSVYAPGEDVRAFSAKFVSLPPEWQEEFITRNIYGRGM